MTAKQRFLAWCRFDFVEPHLWPRSIRALLGQKRISNQDRFKAFCFFYGNIMIPQKVWDFMLCYPLDQSAIRQIKWLFRNVNPNWTYWDVYERRTLSLKGKPVY